MIHHSALSRKRLRSMKILDKCSCYVTALNDDLSSKEMFEQFGAVLSFRVLKDTDPKQLYVRYTDEAAAADAVAWCSQKPSAFEDAKHGFNRYCSKFIHGKECTNEACENRHSWAETKDILTFLERVPTQCVAATSPVVAAKPVKPSPCEDYVRVSALQDRIIDDLLREINELKRLNQSLEKDAAVLQRQRNSVAMNVQMGFSQMSQMAMALPMAVGSCSPMSAMTPTSFNGYELGSSDSSSLSF